MSKKDLILAGEKEQLQAIGHQVKTLLPGGSELTDNQAISVGNYAELTGANPFRGEIYGYQDKKGNLVLVDGYKLLIRWAKKISDYDETYSERLPSGVEGINDGDIGYRITLLRHDKKSVIKEYVNLGATFREAYDLVANTAVGIVKVSETRNAPPKGWSWDGVARKRALKNVLNLAYAMPSIEELRQLNWEVNDTQTIPEDWTEPEIYNTTEEAERHAELAAQERQRQEKVAAMGDKERRTYNKQIKEATDLMRNNGDDDPLDLSPELEEITAEIEIPQPLQDLRDMLVAEIKSNPRQGKATDKQSGLIRAKLTECFAGDNDAPERAEIVWVWLFEDENSYHDMRFPQAQAIQVRLIPKRDEATGDYPITNKFAKTLREVYAQWRLEQGG
jgi:hypothetical protein